MVNSRLYDVIVVGAGPSGNITALKLSSMGHRVLVLDDRHRIGDKLCTGIIGPDCVGRFPPEDYHVYHKAHAATMVSPNKRRYRVVKSKTQAFIIDRVAYVESFALQAMEKGADYQLGHRVTNVEISTQTVRVQANGSGENLNYQARMVILANGFNSRLLDMVHLSGMGKQDFMVGSQTEVEVKELHDTEIHLGGEISSGSFGWIVPTMNSRALVGIATRSRLNGQMDQFLSVLKDSGKVRKVIKKTQQWGIPVKPLRKTYGERVIVVGDAAGLVKPTTGGGIYYAMLSGEIAAETVNDALLENDLSARRLRRYEKNWKDAFGLELKVGYYARVLFESLGPNQINGLIDLCHEIQDELIDSREFSFDWHSGVIRKAMSHRKLATVLLSSAPRVSSALLSLAKNDGALRGVLERQSRSQ